MSQRLFEFPWHQLEATNYKHQQLRDRELAVDIHPKTTTQQTDARWQEGGNGIAPRMPGSFLLPPSFLQQDSSCTLSITWQTTRHKLLTPKCNASLHLKSYVAIHWVNTLVVCNPEVRALAFQSLPPHTLGSCNTLSIGETSGASIIEVLGHQMLLIQCCQSTKAEACT